MNVSYSGRSIDEKPPSTFREQFEVGAGDYGAKGLNEVFLDVGCTIALSMSWRRSSDDEYPETRIPCSMECSGRLAPKNFMGSAAARLSSVVRSRTVEGSSNAAITTITPPGIAALTS